MTAKTKKAPKTQKFWGLYMTGLDRLWNEFFHTRGEARRARHRPSRAFAKMVKDQRDGKRPFPAAGVPVRISITVHR